MNHRIPILYDAALRPEWIDYALDRFISAASETELRATLTNYLRPQIKGDVTLDKAVRQLQRTAGYKSPLPKDQLTTLHCKMSMLSPSERVDFRIYLLTASNAFVSDCINVIKRLTLLGVDGIEIKHVYERVSAQYGDRSTVYRRVRYVLQTLLLCGFITNRDHRWFLVDSAVATRSRERQFRPEGL